MFASPGETNERGIILMDKGYSPDNLIMEVAIRSVLAGKATFPQDLSQLKKTYVKIFKKDKSASPFTILKDPNRSDAAILLLSGARVMNHASLEEAKDELGSVEVSYEGRKPETFDTFQQFLEWLQLK